MQYTHARAASVLKNGKAPEAFDVAAMDLSSICKGSAYELVKELYALPGVILEACEKNEPSVLTRHIVDIAQAFNKFYHDEHIIVENEAEKNAKLLLTAAAKQAIKNGLGILGIKAPEKM